MTSPRLLWSLAVAGMALLVYLIIGDTGFRAPPRPDAGAPLDAAPPAPAPLPLLMPEPDLSLGPDLSVPEDTPSLEVVERFGVFGRDTRFLSEFLARGEFKSIADRGGPTFKDELGTVLTFRVEGGRISGARADFFDEALSAHLSGMSWIFSGHRGFVPLHWESMDEPGKVFEGSYEDGYGRMIHYRGALQGGSRDVYGPAFMELSTRPLKATP